ncbi:glucosamine inositolphosphorylceramide transferase family protein [Paenibacillus aceris]|uniref:Glucosamine inositolphosphorylceramide transferase 1 N-terminal domain-containing protein n=1 Tax=Paenibacillus aceris TaxID=869555 RepID=A0ABS4I806_9BACL|nr:hypothetical protein [Paenibacillus aceris]MBP1967067.1 hypothetical protein [Paenibacillus aceris]NHW33264.1 hypothetical protein [Paenibacillus aceris]
MPLINTRHLKSINNLVSLIRKGMDISTWSIVVFNSDSLVSSAPQEINLEKPTLQASDVTDVPAEFVADPFIIQHDSEYFLFFEVLNKASGRGEIGLATSADGHKWDYQCLVLRERYHLSYPQVFKYMGDYFMLPETSEANRVILYRSRRFPFEWEVACELFSGRFLDPSIVNHNDKWWVFTGTREGNFHLFYSEKLEGPWIEHHQSPIISNNMRITRPGGRVVVSDGNIYRYTQSVYPHYGNSVSVFKINKLSEIDYEEEEITLILSGTNRESDWRKDGMHHIDQLKLNENQWLVAVDGHRNSKSSYLAWKLNKIKAKIWS